MSAPQRESRRAHVGRSVGVRDVLAFFALTGLITTPFWAVSAASHKALMPGLPLAALAVVCPAVAALVLTWRRGGRAAARALVIRTLDAGRVGPRVWWLPILLLSPAVSAACFLILRAGGSAVPDPAISVLSATALFAVFLFSALLEEAGWTGFALDPLQRRLGFVPAALLIGTVWAVWHFPALFEARRSPDWIAWWSLGTVSLRVIMVWFYNRTGGAAFAAVMVHAVSNLCWQVFPVHGSWFDPRLQGEVLGALALALILVSIRPGAGLRRGRGSPPPP